MTDISEDKAREIVESYLRYHKGYRFWDASWDAIWEAFWEVFWAEYNKPKTVTINGRECPDDFIRSGDKVSEDVFIEDASTQIWCSPAPFNSAYMQLYINHGIAHRTKEGAIAACKARHSD